jgi:hypothetical protein
MRVLNPLVWLWNNFKYMAFLETQRNCQTFEAYDFSEDTRYF